MKWLGLVLSVVGIFGLGAWLVSGMSYNETSTVSVVTATPSPSPHISPTPSQSYTIMFGGDVMVGRYVESLMNNRGEGYPFKHLKSMFADVDTTVINLEGPIPLEHIQTPNGSTNFSFKKSYVEAIRDAGVDIVSLANNHTADKGQESLIHTRSLLTDIGLQYFGSPNGIGKDSYVRIVAKPQSIILVGLHATGLAPFDPKKATQLVAQLREDYPNDSIIPVIHWGEEYNRVHNSYQENLAHNLIDAGAEAIIGHHPHVVQDIEKYQGKYIFYSLGNLVFDQYFSRETQEMLLIQLTIDPKKGISYTLIPLISNTSQPKLMDEAAKTAFFQQLRVPESGVLP